MYIRKASLSDAGEIADVHVKSWQTTYHGILPQNVLDNLSIDTRTKQWEKNIENGDVYVAENPDGFIVGLSTGGRESTGKYLAYTGELYAIYILETYQRQGIGRQLLKPVLDELEAHGIYSLLVWALKHNPAAYFYQALGAKYIDKKEIQMAGETYLELAYGWQKLPEIR